MSKACNYGMADACIIKLQAVIMSGQVAGWPVCTVIEWGDIGDLNHSHITGKFNPMFFS